MKPRGRIWVLCAVALAIAATPAAAQLEDNLSAYTGANAEGYLQPLEEAFGQTLNSNLFSTAYVPRAGLRLRVELKAMSVFFKNGDDTFMATTGEGFAPQQTVSAPTVVGSESSVAVNGQGGSQFVFPGGFDLGALTIAVPQVTVGTFAGTEAVGRWVSFDTGNADIGKITLAGFGLRHSLSQYLLAPPVDLAVAGYYQKLKLGDDLVNAHAFSLGLQASRGIGMLTPYGGVAYDTFTMTADYTATAGGTDQNIHLELKTRRTLHLTAGLGLDLGVVHLNVSGDVAQRVGVNAGVAVGL